MTAREKEWFEPTDNDDGTVARERRDETFRRFASNIGVEAQMTYRGTEFESTIPVTEVSQVSEVNDAA